MDIQVALPPSLVLGGGSGTVVLDWLVDYGTVDCDSPLWRSVGGGWEASVVAGRLAGVRTPINFDTSRTAVDFGARFDGKTNSLEVWVGRPDGQSVAIDATSLLKPDSAEIAATPSDRVQTLKLSDAHLLLGGVQRRALRDQAFGFPELVQSEEFVDWMQALSDRCGLQWSRPRLDSEELQNAANHLQRSVERADRTCDELILAGAYVFHSASQALLERAGDPRAT